MTAGNLIIAAILMTALSGIPALFLRNRTLGQNLATAILVLGSLIGLAGAITTLGSGRTEIYGIAWSLPFGPCEIGVDPLGAIFLLVVFAISGCCAVYATGYWPAADNPATVHRITFFFGLLTAAMALLVTARNGVLFLMAWEVMALSCYFLLSTEDEKADVREAATLYLITTHLGTLSLFAMFSLLQGAAGSFLFPPAGSLNAATPLATGIFVTALLGFGLKAGLMPLHIWLPSAHANAPSHISAFMSGVLIKMGIYGLVRSLSLFHNIPLWWGITVLVIGIISGVAGVAFAIGQHDLKRLLAYHSIENIGIIAMGIGVALIGQAVGNTILILLGMAGALLHVLNHATFKALLFLAAGAVIHATGTREIDLMGGLARRMPYTAAFFLVGAVAICGLPPLNGFVSEFLIYVGLFSGILGEGGTAVAFLALSAPALALIGGLAVACFIKVYGVAFLGVPRAEEAAHGHEAVRVMLAPMALLATICMGIGIFPRMMAGPLAGAVHSWQPAVGMTGPALTAAAPLGWITIMGLVQICLAGGVAAHFIGRLKAEPVSAGVTWGCGYLRPTPRMQYTASSFAELLVKTFAGILHPHVTSPAMKEPLPGPARFASHVPETMLEHVFMPVLRLANDRLAQLRRLQHGQLHLYILYTFVTLVVLLIWAY
ncbi:proton-conducting transporter membrane subunit [Geobacter sp. AOG1]|uniref:proton-conducting transporter transmembrane domain-containing protein n=1 Tax=Geobacter sp. AOG1 TaxID=1566346 RepID=UPI001CC7A2CB|nr:proton-conducting transporter membrane subunit [Geobacter sp. AOG1]GFE57497.1 hydrogenase [Geobacter sp. AOG1]